MQKNWRTEYFKNLIKDKNRLKRWRRMLLCLSCVVIFCTVYTLILPAITLESKKCNVEEHIHGAECYSEKQELICGKEEHRHTPECTPIEIDSSDAKTETGIVADAPKNEENSNKEDITAGPSEGTEVSVIPEESAAPETTKEPSEGTEISVIPEESAAPETTEETEIAEAPVVTGEYVLNDHADKIKSVTLTYEKDGTKVDVTNTGMIKAPDDTYLKITVAFKDIPQTVIRDTYNRSFVYKLPEFFHISKAEVKDMLDGTNKKIGTIEIKNDKVVITYAPEFLTNATEGDILNGSFYVEGEIKLSKLNQENGTIDFTVPNGTITLDYGADYLQKYGKITVEKSCSKPVDSSEYIRYTIKVTASENGAKNVVVVDTFTENKQVIKSYENIPKVETVLNSTPDGQKPYETIENNNSAAAGKIYLGTAPTEENKIPVSNSASETEPGSLVWKIDSLAAGESRTLTYYAKLQDEGGKISTKNNQNIKNKAQLYTTGKENTIYDKGGAESTFTPHIEYTMVKNVENHAETPGGELSIRDKDEDGNYIIKYKLSFTLKENSNYPLKNFVFWDDLTQSTESSILPYIEYDRNSVELHKESQTENITAFDVYWSEGNDYLAEPYVTKPTRFKIMGTNGNPINIYPGETYYVTYQVKVRPEIYAVAQENRKNGFAKITNRFIASAQNACNQTNAGIIDGFNTDAIFREYTWVQKTKEDISIANTNISIPQGEQKYRYNEAGGISEITPEEVTSFSVPSGSYKYTVNVNKTADDWDVTDTTMTDTLNPSDILGYVGYLKITAYEEETDTVVGTKWVDIAGKSEFSLKPSQIGWKDTFYWYKFEYYASPKNLGTVSKVDVTNTFKLDKAKRNNGEFPFGDDVKASQTVTVSGGFNFAVQKKAWYYEKPKENATSWEKGKLYWVIEASGSAIQQGTQIKDQISRDRDLTDSWMHNESLVGIYKGTLEENYIDTCKSFEDFEKKNLTSVTEKFTSTYENGKNFTNGCYSELILTANENIALTEGEKIYVVIRTEPQSLPSQYRTPNVYRNEVYKKYVGQTEWGSRQSFADQNLYNGGDILKELGQTFEYDGSTVTNIEGGQDQGNTGRICKDLLTEGVYASWAFKVNYTGKLQGDYRVLEEIPNGMELAYIRIKWPGSQAQDIASKDIVGLGSEWERKTNHTTTDRGKANQETIYYVNQNGKQALIQLGSFKDGKVIDDYSVDVQVVCRVTDKTVLLGGEEKTYTNKVTLQSQNGQEIIATAQADARIQRNSLDKTHTTDGQKINYTITANTLGQKLPTNTQDENKLTLVDTLSSNLELDVDSIRAKDANNQDVVVEKAYDSSTNTLEITIPNAKKVSITYQAIVKAPPSTPVTLTNNVYWKTYNSSGGKMDIRADYAYTINAGGTTTTTTAPILAIQKWDEDTMKPMANVTFDIVECKLTGESTIQHVVPESKYQGVTDENGKLTIPATSYVMKFNTIYEVKEAITPKGYVENDKAEYIMYVNKDQNYNEEYVNKCKQNQEIKMVYQSADFKVQVFNAQRGIIVQKAFINDAAGNSRNPVSGTYWFGLYDNDGGNGTPLDTVSITYNPGDTNVKTAKFKNQDLSKPYYVFELDDKNQPIKASKEAKATINNQQYIVTYSKNAATCGDTVTVTNQSHTKMLPATGGCGTLLYRLAGVILIFFTSLLMLIRYKKQKRECKSLH